MKLLIAFVALLSVGQAFAQTKIVTIDAFDYSYTGGLLIKSDDAKRGSDRDETTFRLNLNYAQNWDQYVGLMWKARLYINREDIDQGSSDFKDTRWGGAAGLLFNFDSTDIKNSIFAGAMLGLERATIEEGGRDDESGFNFFGEIEGGKRFDLGQYSVVNISYAPSASFGYKRYGGDIRKEYFKNGTEFKLHFLKFDILF